MAIENRGLVAAEAPAFIRRVLHDFDRWLGKGETPFFAFPRPIEGFTWLPELEVVEREGQLLVRVDLPGLKQEEITVTVTEEELTIEGERKYEAEKRAPEWYRTERAYGRFFRTVPIPKGVKTEEVKATYTNGVLEIRVPLPAAEERTPRRKVEIGLEREKAVKPAA
ncbi:MAG TPA: Hsp20/alpha crystallin family protein [Vicinamibacterales bacterium]|nr:Hsp20/alpha crystallin family protein [Vicinamibacterales bacterium]